MVRTRVGYAGGTLADPTYHHLGDHTETVQVDYDPDVIGYQDLLEVFWASHSPTSRPWSRQYASIIFFHDEAQREAAESSLRSEEERRGRTLYTEIRPADTFYRAEDYHQKYYLRAVRDLSAEFQAMYPDAEAFTDSTAAARANGFAGGNGTSEQAEALSGRLGLSEAGERTLHDIARGLARRR